MASRAARAVLLLVAVVLVAGGCASTPESDLARSPNQPLTALHGPVLGLLEVDGGHYPEERAAGVQVVTINLGWKDAEPIQGVLNGAEIVKVRGQISEAEAGGFGVVLDPGIQYPPPWVFDLPGGTRFVNQYGDVFSGAPASGNAVANAVTDGAVRTALGIYLSLLGHQLPHDVLAIRQGGGATGELRYPDTEYNGHSNCWWAYDTSSQESSPVPGWKPGRGTVAEAVQFLDTYNRNLVEFGDWMNEELSVDFATTNLVMLPGWGERPGASSRIVNSRLTESTAEWNQGLDWIDLLDSLPHPATSVAYTTYLDAPSFGSTSGEEDPADFVARLAAPQGLRVGGENTGNGTVAALRLTLQRAAALDFVIVNWMSESQLVASSTGGREDGPSFEDMRKSAKALLPKPASRLSAQS